MQHGLTVLEQPQHCSPAVPIIIGMGQLVNKIPVAKENEQGNESHQLIE
jgi:hypothetical protein